MRLIATIYKLNVSHPEDIVSRLEFAYRSASGDEISDEEPSDANQELAQTLVRNLWDSFKRYLRGVGHPDHEFIRVTKVISEEIMRRDAADALLRSKLFLEVISGSELLPVSEGAKLRVR